MRNQHQPAGLPGRASTSPPGKGPPLVIVVTRREETKFEELEDDLVDGILDAAGQRGWRLLDLHLTAGSLTGEQPPIGALTTLLPSDPAAQSIRHLGCPIVRLGHLPHPEDATMPAILPDHEAAGRMTADYFAPRGFHHLAIVGFDATTIMALIGQGWQQRAAALNCVCHQHLLENAGQGPSDPAARAARFDRRAQALTQWLAGLPKPVGLVACNSFIAGMVSIACQRAGLAVPEDVSILAVAGRRGMCEMSPVPISAINVHQPDVGHAAVNLLDDLIHGRPAPPRTLIPPRGIITRRSTDILAVDHPLVARAIRFIWDQFAHDLSVDEVAQALRTPRYKLERLFKRHLQRGINAELRRVRLERFRELLRTTDLTVDELTRRIGYRSAKRLHSVFHQRFGMTPRQYRLQSRMPAPDP